MMVVDIYEFLEWFESALRKEEEELGGIQSKKGVELSTRISVRNFNEVWLQSLVFKESIRRGMSNHLDFEKGKVDYCLLDSDGNPLAAIEVKGPFDVSPRGTVSAHWRREIRADICKQLERKKLPDCRQRYVILLPWGNEQDIETWSSEQLGRIIADHRKVESFSLLPKRRMPLNNGKTMQILCYAVHPGQDAK